VENCGQRVGFRLKKFGLATVVRGYSQMFQSILTRFTSLLRPISKIFTSYSHHTSKVFPSDGAAQSPLLSTGVLATCRRPVCCMCDALLHVCSMSVGSTHYTQLHTHYSRWASTTLPRFVQRVCIHVSLSWPATAGYLCM